MERLKEIDIIRTFVIILLVLYHDDDRSLDFAVPRGRGVPEYGQISYIHIAPGALN